MISTNTESGRLPRRPPWWSGVLLTLAALCAATTAEAATFKIEIDYMDGIDHSHMPSATVITAVQQMFACQGHTLIIDVSDSIGHWDVLRRDPDDCQASLFDYDGSPDSFGHIKANFANHSSDDGWHYCIFAHNFEMYDPDSGQCVVTSSSGLAEMPGWNFVVTLGSFDPNETGTEFEQAATLAHEFGHNLGLSHCGPPDCTGIGNYTPILPSIMSYRYQLAGVRSNLLNHALTVEEALYKEIDYSHGLLCGVDENNLDEPFGTVMAPVDWNCDGQLTTGVAHDINGGSNGWCNSSGSLSCIDDTNEWLIVADPSKDRGSMPTREVGCITWQEWKEVQQEMAERGGYLQPPLTIEDCLVGENVYIGPFTMYPVGAGCDRPFDHVQMAHDQAPEHSVFFFKPGVYHDTSVYGTVILNKPGTYMSNIGTARVD